MQNQMERILFVDDEQSILNIASEYFKHKGYQVLTAHDGLEAVEILKKDRVDCCFTDINMPGMNGLELAEHIRNCDNTIPVIIMTGFPSLENTIQTLKNGVVDFLIKPVNLNQMELCVRRVFNQRRLFIENVLLQKEVENKAKLEKLNQELMVKIEELNVLNRILSDLSATTATTDVFNRIVNMANEITQSNMARFSVVNDAVREPFEIVMATNGRMALVRDDAERQSVANLRKDLNPLVLETVNDEIPLLIAEAAECDRVLNGMLSVMMVPLKIRSKVFGVLQAAVTDGQKRFNEKDLYYLSFMAQNAANAIENLALYENIYENLFSTLYAFVNAIEARDRYTQQHSSRVTSISLVIGKAIGCTSEELEVLNFAGHLHDIGKIGIRDDILLKPGKLTTEEFEKIKLHPTIGANIVGQLGLWEREQQIIRCHHERFDGAGYPNGIQRDEIPLLSRILSVADVYDAISSDRAYRKRMEEDQVLKIISDGAGTQFDPELVSIFLRLYHEGAFQSGDDGHSPNELFLSASSPN